MVQYIYTPLDDDQIRLLEISPGKPGDAVRCRLVHCPLEESYDYCALSYHWGPPVFDQEIYLPLYPRDRSLPIGEATLAVTSSLYSALQIVRDEDDVLVVWADAVCINQSDIPERNSQLLLMRRIYQNAESTLICLGDEYEDSNLVPHLIQEILRGGFDDPDERGWAVAIERADGVLSLENPAWGALNALFRRPWFKRVWVIQEAALARQGIIFCGSWSLLFDNFDRAMQVGMYHFQDSDEETKKKTIAGRRCFETIRNIRGLIRDGYLPGLLGLMYLARRAWASKPVDYLYGVLGVSAEGEEAELQPDYAEPVAETLKRYSNHFVFSGDFYSLLEFAHISAWEDGHPSWYPNWASHRSDKDIWMYHSTGQNHYQFEAGGTLQNEIGIVDDGENNLHHLIVKGIVVDVIEKMGEDKRLESSQLGGAYADNLPRQLLKRWFTEMDDMEPAWYVTPAELFEAKWQTLVMGALAPKPYNYADCYNVLVNDIPRPPPGEMGTDGKTTQFHYDISLLDYLGKINTATRVLTLCRTKRGMLGMVPRGTEPGDLVVVFLGLRVPFILRPLPGGEAGHRIVGGCYIHGIMRGEALTSVVSIEDEQLLDFRIT